MIAACPPMDSGSKYQWSRYTFSCGFRGAIVGRSVRGEECYQEWKRRQPRLKRESEGRGDSEGSARA